MKFYDLTKRGECYFFGWLLGFTMSAMLLTAMDYGPSWLPWVVLPAVIAVCMIGRWCVSLEIRAATRGNSVPPKTHVEMQRDQISRVHRLRVTCNVCGYERDVWELTDEDLFLMPLELALLYSVKGRVALDGPCPRCKGIGEERGIND